MCKTKMNLQQHNVNTSIRPKFSISNNHALFPDYLMFWLLIATGKRKSEKLNFTSFLALSQAINSVFHMPANICNW